MSGLTRTIFEGAVAYARGQEERLRDHNVTIRMYLEGYGISIIVTSYSPSMTNRHMVAWHDIEHGQYDALRLGIDTALRNAGLKL